MNEEKGQETAYITLDSITEWSTDNLDTAERDSSHVVKSGQFGSREILLKESSENKLALSVYSINAN